MAYVLPRDLKVYKKAFEQAVVLHQLSLHFPKTEQFGGVADQLRRSTKSICANVAEGLGKHMSGADKRKFIQIALGSAVETQTWLEFAKALGFISHQQFQAFDAAYNDIGAMLYGLMEKVG